MANLEKHVKSLPELLMDSDSTLVPMRARGAHLVGEYIKSRHRGRPRPPARTRHPRASYILRLDGLRATSESIERMQRRVAAINNWLEKTDTQFRLRVINVPEP